MKQKLNKSIVIYGRVPSKKNSKIIVCRGKFPSLLPSKNYTLWHKDAEVQLKNQDNVIKNSEITMIFFSPDNRKYDLTNKAESIMDLLVDCNFIADDNYTIINKLTLIHGGVDKENPRVEIM